MKYRVPRLPAEPGGPLWITDPDETRRIRLDMVPHGRAAAVLVGSEDGESLAAIRLQRTLGGTTAAVEIGGALFATLSLQGRKHQGAVRVRRSRRLNSSFGTAVRSQHGEYIVAGDFETWDFHVLLNTSPVADVAPRKTERAVALVETSDHEEQLPLLALILAVDLLVQVTR